MWSKIKGRVRGEAYIDPSSWIFHYQFSISPTGLAVCVLEVLSTQDAEISIGMKKEKKTYPLLKQKLSEKKKMSEKDFPPSHVCG